MIIVFDSGVGGLSILREILNQHVTSAVTYVADQVNFPYGSKSESWLTDRLCQVARWAAGKNPTAFVLACNTATVSSITAMREILPCPVVGVEPVIKPLAAYGNALILATHVTADSPRTRELLAQYGGNVRVATPDGLADAIENTDSERVKKILETIAHRVKNENIEAIGLSCTHYPLIAAELHALLPGVHIYDPAPAVVFRLKQVLSPGTLFKGTDVTYLTTGPVVRLKDQIKKYTGQDVSVGHSEI